MPIAPTALVPDAHDLERHRTAIRGHCYRMLGSIGEADDATQETLIRAWKHLGGFEGRSSLKTWTLRIATRVCLDALEGRKRRGWPPHEGPAGFTPGVVPQPGPVDEWIEPAPDPAVIPADLDPAEGIALRQSVRIAMVAALQRLPARQRAVLLLREVLDQPAAEVAEALGTTVASVNSAMQRARATLSVDAPPAELSPSQRALLDRYVQVFEAYDLDALQALLHEEATLTMPPYALWFQGPADIRAWMDGPGAGCRGSKLVPIAANGVPAFGQYRRNPDGSGYHPWAIVIPRLDGDRVVSLSYFLDTAYLFPRFGLGLGGPEKI